MGPIGGSLGYRILRTFSPGGLRTGCPEENPYEGGGKLHTLFGSEIWNAICDKPVVDFECGHGLKAIEIASRGARQTIGFDISHVALK